MQQHMLTTIDNPYDPFEQWFEWYAWDQREGYDSTGLLARTVKTSEELSEADQLYDVSKGIDFIIRHDPLNIYIKVSKEVDLEQIPFESEMTT